MKRKGHDQVTFKPYTQAQLMLPTSLEELIPEDHLVRVVNRVIDALDLEALLRRYKGGGTSSYHPRMMLKVLVYAYTQRIYSSRQIAKALRENVNFMWLAGGNRPDFRTVNGFRGERMREVIGDVFAEVLEYLAAEGYVKLETYFVDGTKIEANANRYGWVWAKNVRRYQGQVREKIEALLEEIDRVNEEEQAEYGDEDLEELGGRRGKDLDSEELASRIAALNERLKQQPDNKPLAKAVRELEREYRPRLERYEAQEEVLAGRNSYAKTDEDATFMRMKEDHLQTAQLKPAYNVQMGTENQFVVGYSVHQQASDSACLIRHLESVQEMVGQLPSRVVADAGYGSEENYAYLEGAGVEGFVKYPLFDRERKRSWRKQVYRVENWPYDAERDEFTCPEGKPVRFRTTYRERTANGYVSQRRRYECAECADCPVKARCTRAAGNRTVHVSLPLLAYRERARSNLLSEEGKRLRSRRGVEVETVFGRLKHNWGFRRFMLRGLEKVKIEWGMLCIAHNMAKLAA
ncbi:MAG: IS1182 family transposase [bacterium]|nr:IS1182 family transposase [bacterium]